MDPTLTAQFETHRPQLRAMALRMLGAGSEADDAVQEAWLRLSRTENIDNLGGWLTTVVSRVCLDMLRARKRRGDPVAVVDDAADDAESRADVKVELADTIGVALLVVLENLGPDERIAFVLHDMFDLPFEDIAAIVEKSPEAVRQLASRARRRIRGQSTDIEVNRERQHALVAAFMAASRGGDLDGLLAVLAPDAVVRADAVAVATAARNASKGAPPFAAETRGARGVADTFNGRAKGARLALIDGRPGAFWGPGEKPMVVFAFTLDGDKVTAIDVVMDPAQLEKLEVHPL